MFHRFVLVAAVPGALSAAAFAGFEPPRAERSTTQQHAFWQEADELVFDTRTCDAVCVDLDGDGRPELARLGIEYGNPHGGKLEVVRGGAYGPQGAAVLQIPVSSPRSIRAADVNGDGRVDLVVAHLRPLPGTANLFVRCARFFLRTGASSGAIEFVDPAPCVDLAPGGELALLADVDGDGLDDLVSTGVAHELYYQAGLGAGSGSPPLPAFAAQAVSVSRLAAQAAGLPAGSSYSFGFANDLEAGDFDGDGSIDLAVAVSSSGGGVHVFYRRAQGWTYQNFGYAVPGAIGANFTSLVRGDFDRNGFDDLAVSSISRDLTTLLNTASGSGRAAPADMREVISTGVGRNMAQLASADFDGDAVADIAGYDTAAGRMLVAFNAAGDLPPGEFAPWPELLGSYALSGSAPRALDALDVDRDGDVDLVCSFLSSQSTSVLSNELQPNRRKPHSAQHLRGDDLGSDLAGTWLPDATEYEQGSSAAFSPGLALDRFTFRSSAAAGDRLRLRVRLQGVDGNAVVRLGVQDLSARRVRWLDCGAVGADPVERVFDVHDAQRFVSLGQELQLLVISSAHGSPFRLEIDQLSAEIVP